MTRTGLVDLSAAPQAPVFPSPALLAAAPAGAIYLEPAALADVTVDRLIAVVPAWRREDAKALLAQCRAPVEVLDPWATPSTNVPAYKLAPRACHGDIDLAPHGWPVHPWVAASAPGAGDATERLRAASAGLSGLAHTRLLLGDERERLSQDRLRLLASLVSASLKDRKSLIELGLRVWPEDLGGERIIDHLSLLPIGRLELLAGSLHAPSLATRGALDPGELVKLIAALAAAGLAHLTTISLAVALPGESVHDAIGAIDRALRLAAEHRVAGVRCAVWIGDGGPPADPAEQQQRFRASHPDWQDEEYRGLHDIVAVLRGVAKGIELVGPGFMPAWDSVP